MREAAYRALLYCYPAAFRQEYGDQMRLMFDQQLGEARRTGGRIAEAALWLRATLDALIVAPKEHGHVIHQDLRYALRTMLSSPGFTTVAILSLALGIGANTAIFSLWNSVLHSSLPGVDRPEQLVILSNPDTDGSWHGRWVSSIDGDRAWLSYAEFEQLRDQAGAFAGLMATQSSLEMWRVRFAGGEEERASGRMVSGGFFQVLGVNPAFGRVFTAADDHVEFAPEAVISYSYWQRRFGARRDVIGKSLTLRKTAFTIIGIAPPGFIGETNGQQPDLWLPLRMQPFVMPGEDWLHDPSPNKIMWLQVFGRLKPQVTQAQAGAQANAIFKAGLESFYGDLAKGERGREFLDQRLGIQPAGRGASNVRNRFSSALTALLAAVGVLLLIACANLANLLLARGAARRPEIALRLSLGASRGRLIRQLITESLVLAAAGGVTGLAVGYVLQGALVRMIAESDPSFGMRFTLEPMVLLFTVAVTSLAAMLFGILPAWQMAKTDAAESLKEQGRGATGSIGRMRWGRLLVSLQLALSLPLLVGAGLLARTLYNLERLDLGYPPKGLLQVQIDPSGTGYNPARMERLARDLQAQFQRIPGVKAASFSALGVFSGGNASVQVAVEGYTPKGSSDSSSGVDMVGPGYFSTVKVPILRGREIAESDNAAAPKICAINEAFAKRFFGTEDPIGRLVTQVGDTDAPIAYRVVAVVKNARTRSLRGDVEPRFFIPAAQDPAHGYVFLIRAATEATAVLPAVRDAVRTVDAALPIYSAGTIEEEMAPLTARDRSIALLAVLFGAVALTLAAIGLYGVLSYGVARRKSEIAIRIALGAQPGRVIRMILGETAGLVIVGLALGAGLAYAASRLITTQLFGVAPQDPLTLALAVGLLLLVALSAAYLPALRTSRLDPMTALRSE